MYNVLKKWQNQHMPGTRAFGGPLCTKGPSAQKKKAPEGALFFYKKKAPESARPPTVWEPKLQPPKIMGHCQARLQSMAVFNEILDMQDKISGVQVCNRNVTLAKCALGSSQLSKTLCFNFHRPVKFQYFSR